jgi:asparagine synthase (glutamine-hydrolysing)
VPLLDNQVIDFAATLPSHLKIANGRRKHVLKEAVRTLLPAGIIDRKKQGFGVPLGVWFRGGLTDIFSDVLKSPRTRQRGYFEPAFVDRLVTEHLSGRRDHTLRLWQLMMFELWHRQYLDAPMAVEARAAAR